MAHSSGALSLPNSNTLLIADLHLGYSWAQRRRGELGPLADEQTRAKLLSVCQELQPVRVVFLGDLVHAPKPCGPERDFIRQLLLEVCELAQVVVVRGNHDRAFARDFADLPLQTAESWSEDGIFAVHGDQLPASVPDDHTLVVGHLHPSLSVRDAAGAAQRLPVFLATKRCLILPAFSPFARGYDISCGFPPELLPYLGADDVQAYIASSSRVLPLGALRSVIERMLAADASSPAHFRRMRRG